MIRRQGQFNIKRILLLVFVFSLHIVSFSQGPVYQSTSAFGGTDHESLLETIVDQDGNVYSTGYFGGTVDFDPGSGVHILTAIGNSDIFISKLDPQGRLVWAKAFGGTGFDHGQTICLNQQNQVVVGGVFQNTVDFDPGDDTFTVSAAPGTDLFISIFDTQGNFIRVKTIGGATGTATLNNLNVDKDDNIYSTGYFTDTVAFDESVSPFISPRPDVFLLKMDPSGNFIWVKQFGGDDIDIGRSIDFDEEGNVYTTGMFTTTGDFDPGPSVYNLTSAGAQDVFIIKLDTGGNLIWAKSVGGTEWDDVSVLKYGADHVLYFTGLCNGTVDFDPGPGVYNVQSHGDVDAYVLKLNSEGELQWAGTIGGPKDDRGEDLALDPAGNVYVCGSFDGLADMDPGVNNYPLDHSGYRDAYMIRLDANGNLVWASRLGGAENDEAFSILADPHNNVICSGLFRETVDFDPGTTKDYFQSAGDADIFITHYSQHGVVGSIYQDIVENCVQASNEIGMTGRLGQIEPLGLVVQTDVNGRWYVDSLPIGYYEITFDTAGQWKPTCPVTSSFEVTDADQITLAPDFGLKSIKLCPIPSVSLNIPFRRRCFPDQYVYVSACNLPAATAALFGGFVIVQLDPIFIPTSASVPFTDLGLNRYRFEVGTLFPGECFNFSIATTISCDASLEQTICAQAYIYPNDNCNDEAENTLIEPGSPPCAYEEDHSNVNVEGWCSNDSLYFAISNSGAVGSGNMKCYAPIRLWVDTKMIWKDSIQLDGGESDTLVYSGDGRTWRMEVDQHPMHAARSHPNATVERCGNQANWTPGLFNELPLDDEGSFVDINCNEVKASYDPNDKTGYPLGIGAEHLLQSNRQLEYTVRFQNTGTDTAFFVVIRDTLDEDVDIFSVHPGAASHPYQFRMYGNHILEWRLEHILLPDSTTDLAGSNGFVSFTADQKRSLPLGTKIENKAAIYFDYNDPVITNVIVHTIGNINQPSWSQQKELALTSCGSFMYNHITYNKTGSYWQIAAGGNGVDTLVTINLVVLTSPDFLEVDQQGNILSAQAVADAYQWLDCLTGNSIAGETSPVFSPTYNGEFAVIVSQNGCIDTSECYNVTMVGTEQNNLDEEMSIYPNPTTGDIVVDFKQKKEKAEFILYDLVGREVLHQHFAETAMERISLPSPGIYFLLVRNGSEYHVFRVIRE